MSGRIHLIKFEDAIRHLKSLGLAAVMPDGTLHPISRKLRHARGLVPAQILKRGSFPKDLREMIRQSGPEARYSHRTRRNG